MRGWLILCCALALTGCADFYKRQAATTAASDDATCRSYGYVPRTPGTFTIEEAYGTQPNPMTDGTGYADCRQRIAETRAEGEAMSAAASAAAWSDFTAAELQRAQEPAYYSRPITSNCSWVGQYWTCSTF